MKKTLLFISHSSSSTGGGEEDFLRLLKYFSDKYYLIGIFPDGPRASEYKSYVNEYLILSERMLPFTNFNLKHYAGYFLKAFPKIREINNFLEGKKIDLAYINSSVCLYEAMAVNKLKIPYVISVKEFVNPVWIRDKMNEFYLKSASEIIVISKLLREEFIKLNKYIDKVNLIYPGIENTEIKKQQISNRIVIVNIGNVYRQKGQHKVIEAISKIKCSGGNILLKIIGAKINKNYLNYLNSLILKYNLRNNVLFTGELPRERVLQEISNSKAVVISSYQEGFSLVLLEALSQKIPVISTEVGVIPEVITDGENGILYDYEDSDMLAEKIDILLSDDSLCNKVAENGYLTYKNNFDLNVSLKRHYEVFQSVLNA